MWDAGSGKELPLAGGHRAPVSALLVALDGKTATVHAAAFLNGAVQVCESDGKIVALLAQLAEEVMKRHPFLGVGLVADVPERE